MTCMILKFGMQHRGLKLYKVCMNIIVVDLYYSKVKCFVALVFEWEK